jgi:hypothetical protein
VCGTSGLRLGVRAQGNKCDSATARAIASKEGEDFAAAHDLRFMEASARAQTNIKEIFAAVARQLVDGQK